MIKIDAHVHACGMLVDTKGVMEYIEKNDLTKIVLTAGEPDSDKVYKMPYLGKTFKHSSLIYSINNFISFVTQLKKTYTHIDQGNEKVALIAKELPEYVLNTYWINPLEEDAIEKMEKFYNRYSFCMIKMHQCWTDFDICNKNVDNIISWGEKRKIPIFLHLKSKGQVLKFKEVLKTYQEVTFILGHLIGIEEFKKEDGDNVYFDISCAPLHSVYMLKEAYTEFSGSKIILGSDAPYGIDNINLAIAQMIEVGMSEEDMERVCHINIEQILNIK